MLETAEFTNHLSFLAIFMLHGLICAPFLRVTHKLFATLHITTEVILEKTYGVWPGPIRLSVISREVSIIERRPPVR